MLHVSDMINQVDGVRETIEPADATGGDPLVDRAGVGKLTELELERGDVSGATTLGVHCEAARPASSSFARESSVGSDRKRK